MKASTQKTINKVINVYIKVLTVIAATGIMYSAFQIITNL